ncbi:MAG: hypothetical protein H7067_07720 [Burkholderiales bacterium]|nr:hypothetical protein [Opitutaceae bacterium]
MNAGQIKAYRAEVAKWRAACVRLGRPSDDDARRALHQACNAPASSTAFTNAQLDRVLAKLRSFSQMDNLSAQLRPDEEASRRINAAQRRCYAAVATLTGCHSAEDSKQSLRRKNYLETMARRVCARGWDALDEAGVVKLAYVLESRARPGARPGNATPPQSAEELSPAAASEPGQIDHDAENPFG